MGSRSNQGQKNFALGGAKDIFEQWCELNALKEPKVILASFLAFQSLDPKAQKEFLNAAIQWEKGGFKHDEEWKAVVGDQPTNERGPAEKVPSRVSRRAAS